jgi:hypothetical protein
LFIGFELTKCPQLHEHLLTFSELFPGILNPAVLGIANDFDQDLIAEVIITLLDYMDLIDSLQPFRSPLPASPTAELDSQGSFDFMNMERQIMIHVCSHKLLFAVLIGLAIA